MPPFYTKNIVAGLIGIFTALNDADIKLRADDPNNLVSDADLAKEKRSIENDNENIISFLQVGLSYRF